MDPTACSCPLCVPEGGTLKAEIDKQLAEKINQALLSSFASPPYQSNEDQFAANDEDNPPDCPGCGETMLWSPGFTGNSNWTCSGECYYCEKSSGCGFQDQDLYCQGCYGCHEHCECDEETGDGDGDSSQYGKSQYPGWTVRGLKIEITSVTEDHEAVWGFRSEDHDLVQEMASFYVKEFVVSNAQLLGVDRALMSAEVFDVMAEAKGLLDEQIARLDPVLQAYIDMAVGGELRYHLAMKAIGLGKGSFSREKAWNNWKVIRDTVGPEALLDAAKLAREVNGGGILGKAWAVPAEVLHARITGTMDPKTFVDRAFSLQHNGGCLFNKLVWATKNRPGWDLQAIQWMIGPAHASNPIRWGPLLAAADADSVRLFNRYWKTANKVRAKANLGIEVLPSWRDGLVVRPGPYDHPQAGYEPAPEIQAERGLDFFRWNNSQSLIDGDFGPLTIDSAVKADIDEQMGAVFKPEDLPTSFSYGCYAEDCKCQWYQRVRDEAYNTYYLLNRKYSKVTTKTSEMTLRNVVAGNGIKDYLDQLRRAQVALLNKVTEKNSCPNTGTKKVVETKVSDHLDAKPHPDAVWSPGGYGGGGKWVMPFTSNASKWADYIVIDDPVVKYSNTYVNATASTSTLSEEVFDKAYKQILNNPWQ